MPELREIDRRPESIAIWVRDWLAHVAVDTTYVEQGGPWQSDYCVSFNGMLRNEILDGEILMESKEARTITSGRQYNTLSPYSALHCKPPAPEARINTTIKNLHPMMH